MPAYVEACRIHVTKSLAPAACCAPHHTVMIPDQDLVQSFNLPPPPTNLTPPPPATPPPAGGEAGCVPQGCARGAVPAAGHTHRQYSRAVYTGPSRLGAQTCQPGPDHTHSESHIPHIHPACLYLTLACAYAGLCNM
jgi:hypothetical protein